MGYDPEKNAENCRKYYEKNKERLKARQKERYHADVEKSRAAHRAENERNKEKRSAQKKEYYQQNREQKLAKDKLYYTANPKVRMINSARRRAAKMGWEFNLTQVDLHIPEVCPYLGTPLDYSGGKETVPSIDRRDSTKGYTPDNIGIISYLANTMKSSASDEQLRTFSEAALRLH